jgi:hypothetical protein
MGGRPSGASPVQEGARVRQQIAWYEQAITLLHNMAYDLDIAVNVQRDNDPEDWRRWSWEAVQKRQRELHVLLPQAVLYASSKEAAAAGLLIAVDHVASLSGGFDWSRVQVEHLDQCRDLAIELRKSAVTMGAEAKRILGIAD